MSEQTPEPGETTQNLSLSDRVTALSTQIAGLSMSFSAVELFAAETKKASAAANKANRRTIYGGLSLVVLLIFGIWMADQQHDSTERSKLNSEYNVNACIQANVTRAETDSLWALVREGIGSLNANNPKEQAALEKALLNPIKVKTDKIYAQRDCEQVKDGQLGITTPVPAKK